MSSLHLHHHLPPSLSNPSFHVVCDRPTSRFPDRSRWQTPPPPSAPSPPLVSAPHASSVSGGAAEERRAAIARRAPHLRRAAAVPCARERARRVAVLVTRAGEAVETLHPAESRKAASMLRDLAELNARGGEVAAAREKRAQADGPFARRGEKAAWRRTLEEVEGDLVVKVEEVEKCIAALGTAGATVASIRGEIDGVADAAVGDGGEEAFGSDTSVGGGVGGGGVGGDLRRLPAVGTGVAGGREARRKAARAAAGSAVLAGAAVGLDEFEDGMSEATVSSEAAASSPWDSNASGSAFVPALVGDGDRMFGFGASYGFSQEEVEAAMGAEAEGDGDGDFDTDFDDSRSHSFFDCENLITPPISPVSTESVDVSPPRSVCPTSAPPPSTGSAGIRTEYVRSTSAFSATSSGGGGSTTLRQPLSSAASATSSTPRSTGSLRARIRARIQRIASLRQPRLPSVVGTWWVAANRQFLVATLHSPGMVLSKPYVRHSKALRSACPPAVCPAGFSADHPAAYVGLALLGPFRNRNKSREAQSVVLSSVAASVDSATALLAELCALQERELAALYEDLDAVRHEIARTEEQRRTTRPGQPTRRYRSGSWCLPHSASSSWVASPSSTTPAAVDPHAVSSSASLGVRSCSDMDRVDRVTHADSQLALSFGGGFGVRYKGLPQRYKRGYTSIKASRRNV